MNKNGYTMVELLAVIAIIGLIFTIGIVSYSSLINRSNEAVYESYIDGMHEAAITYVMDNPLSDKSSKKITINELINSGKIDYINNPKDSNDKCSNSYIDVNRKDINGVISYEYKVCLICNDYNEETNQNGTTDSNCKTYIN